MAKKWCDEHLVGSKRSGGLARNGAKSGGFRLGRTDHSVWSLLSAFPTNSGRVLGSEEYQETKIMILFY